MIEYFEALARLKKRGAKINNDTVALEAGRKKGSIKKSRTTFASLLLAINEAATTQSKPADDINDRLLKLNQTIKGLQATLDAAMQRELSLLHQYRELERELVAQRGKKVFPIRGKTL